ncbi:MAG: hypothetical protein ACYC6M_02040 [Terriglobales bacterium]
MKSARLTLSLLALLTALCGNRLEAQSPNYYFHVPYTVQVQDLTLAPGTYSVTDAAVGAMHLLVVRGSGITTPDGKTHVAAFLSPIAVDTSAAATSGLLMVSNGDEHAVVGLRLAEPGLLLTFRPPDAATVELVKRAGIAGGSKAGS